MITLICLIVFLIVARRLARRVARLEELVERRDAAERGEHLRVVQ